MSEAKQIYIYKLTCTQVVKNPSHLFGNFRSQQIHISLELGRRNTFHSQTRDGESSSLSRLSSQLFLHQAGLRRGDEEGAVVGAAPAHGRGELGGELHRAKDLAGVGVDADHLKEGRGRGGTRLRNGLRM